VKEVIVGVLVVLSLALAVFEGMESGARPAGMGDAFTAVADDASAIYHNPAGLGQVDRLNVYAFYELLYGGLGENLHNATLSSAVPTHSRLGTVGVSVREQGFALSSERCLVLSQGVSLAKDLHFGYGLVGYNLSMKGLGQAFAFGLDLGLHARLAKRWTVGFYTHDLNMPQMGKETPTYLPRLLDFGIAYSPVSGITSAVAVSKEVGQETRLKVGQEFQILENLLTVRFGLQTEPVRFTAGLSTGSSNIRLDYALKTHTDLPLTHNLGLSVVF
jgi:hypothetical protein